MSYLKIPNLYKDQTILLFRHAFAMEKIHGTSAHISWNKGQVHYFNGGANRENFLKVLESADLEKRFSDLGHEKVVVYGEAYGGKLQGMSATYGKQLCFAAFEVQIGDVWLSVPQAHEVALQKLGLGFVHYVQIPTDMEVIDRERDDASVQAYKNGIQEPKIREGIVLRPLIELTKNNGERIICKHKRKEFMETATEHEVNPEKRVVLEEAEAIALEWVTEMRLSHVLGKSDRTWTIKDTRDVVVAMIEDVNREGEGEFAPSKEANKAIGTRASKLFLQYLKG